MSSDGPTPRTADMTPDEQLGGDPTRSPATSSDSHPDPLLGRSSAGSEQGDSDASLGGTPASTAQAVSVKLEKLRAFYGSAEQVRGVDLEFKANEVTAIIGPSGCGKSTLVLCINR